MSSHVLRFCPLQSCVDVTFWSELGNRKLDQYKLSETPIEVQGFLTASRHEEIGSMLQVINSSLEPTSSRQQGTHAAPGQLLLLNTIESLKRLDKAAAIQQVGARIWDDILSGAAEAEPHRLLRFLLLAHGDLKHFVFTYWFAFPALKPPKPFTQLSAQPLPQAFPGLQQQICTAADAWRAAPTAGALTHSSGSSGSRSKSASELFFLMRIDPGAGTVQTAGLSSWTELNQGTPAAAAQATAAAGAAAEATEVLLAMFDPCHLEMTPGWPLRNALLLAAVRWGRRRLKVLCVRDSSAGRANTDRSFVVQVELPQIADAWRHTNQASGGSAAGAAAERPEVLGWEANAQGKLLPRTVDLSPLMSPVQLAEQAVDLNLRLMRWRAAPDLDVAKLAATRCLLLGAGTLGCAVARTLLAWGVRHITFVDAATVSYSNPVRQSLFLFEDCIGGGKPKAAAAAAALTAIFPSVQAAGHDFSIPMPGHPPANAKAEQDMEQALSQLHQLVSGHDVVFLLTDTRESRWLPTVLAAAAGKVAITAALGFDTFLVMRHGLPSPHDSSSSEQPPLPQQQQQLGCYFCNDVVAPLNSTIDRTLDQQCTVARPGLAPIAGSIAVELLAALLQHPLAGHAPAPVAGVAAGAAAAALSQGVQAAGSCEGVGALGPVPHMIRGQLSGFNQTCMVGQAFSQCTACSEAVLQQYRADGWGFVRRVLHEPGFLEELTGLAELHKQAAALELGSVSSDEEDKGSQEAADEDWTEL